MKYENKTGINVLREIKDNKPMCKEENCIEIKYTQ
jgi:hypothetical protein